MVRRFPLALLVTLAPLVTLVLAAACDELGSRSARPPLVAPASTACAVSALDSDGDCVANADDRCSGTPAGKPVWSTGEWAGCAGGQLHDGDPLAPGPGSTTDAGPSPNPTPTPPQPSAPDLGPTPNPTPPGVQLTATEKDLVDSINTARKQLGLSTLTVDPLLMCAAHLMIASGGCDHYAGGTWSDRAQKCGVSSQAAFYVNEIIAQGQQDGAECVDSWKMSPGHWKGLTHPKAKTIGVGVRPGDHCWVAMFDCCIMGSE